MDDLTIRKLCAEAMGWKHLGPVGVKLSEEERHSPSVVEKKYPGQLWCLSGGNDWWRNPEGDSVCGRCEQIPDPLHDDAQMVALGKKFPYEFERSIIEWCSNFRRNETVDLNRIVCERIAFAEMEAAKVK